MKIGEFEVKLVGKPRGGSFGKVHEVRTPNGERLALKVLEGEGKEEVYEGFLADEPLLASLGEKEGFVPIVAKGIHRGQPWLLMPFYDESLADRLSRRFTAEETYQLGRKLAVAIYLAHHRRLIHRSLHPENIFFTKKGEPLIADLGIARHVVALRAKARRASGAMRLEHASVYMAPEEVALDEAKLTAQADVYSLGVIFYECLTGETPNAGRTTDAIADDPMDHNFLPLMRKKPDLPYHLAKTITVSLMHNHQRRYKDGSLLAQSLGVLTDSRRAYLEARNLHRDFAQ